MDDPVGAAHAQQLNNLAKIIDHPTRRNYPSGAQSRAIDRTIDALMQCVHEWYETGDHDTRMNASEYARRLAAILQHPSTQ